MGDELYVELFRLLREADALLARTIRGDVPLDELVDYQQRKLDMLNRIVEQAPADRDYADERDRACEELTRLQAEQHEIR